jgi:hypothetical protein
MNEYDNIGVIYLQDFDRVSITSACIYFVLIMCKYTVRASLVVVVVELYPREEKNGITDRTNDGHRMSNSSIMYT